MASAAHVNTLQDYIIQAMPVLSKIPGFFEIVNADEKRYDVIAGAYPDAAFAAMIINNLFHHDREFSEIHQQAFSSIVDGATIPSVRKRYKVCFSFSPTKELAAMTDDAMIGMIRKKDGMI